MRFSRTLGDIFSLEVHGFWNWADWLKQQATAIGREPVFINLDETAVSKASPGAVGMVVSKQWWPGAVTPVHRVPKKRSEEHDHACRSAHSPH